MAGRDKSRPGEPVPHTDALPWTLVCGAGGFIGGHLARRLVDEGHRVRGVDLHPHAYNPLPGVEFVRADLRDPASCAQVLEGVSRVYQLAADMGGAGYLFTGDHDASVMDNSARINLNVAREAARVPGRRVLFTSSACVYPAVRAGAPDDPRCPEDTAYPANPDTEYGWEKLFAERVYAAQARQHGLEIRIARLHNVFGAEGAWGNGREKAPAALCRKVALAGAGGEVEIWGDGTQRRSFLHVDACVEGLLRLMESDTPEPINLGSETCVSIQDLVHLIADVAGFPVRIRPVAGPVGVQQRNAHNERIRARLGWTPCEDLRAGLERTYPWVAAQVEDALARHGEAIEVRRAPTPVAAPA